MIKTKALVEWTRDRREDWRRRKQQRQQQQQQVLIEF